MRYSNVVDKTAHVGRTSSGMSPGRQCWTCNLPKQHLGGRTNKRTGMWSCKTCVEKENEPKPPNF